MYSKLYDYIQGHGNIRIVEEQLCVHTTRAKKIIRYQEMPPFTRQRNKQTIKQQTPSSIDTRTRSFLTLNGHLFRLDELTRGVPDNEGERGGLTLTIRDDDGTRTLLLTLMLLLTLVLLVLELLLLLEVPPAHALS